MRNSKWFQLGVDEGIYKHPTVYNLIGKSYLGESIEGILLMNEEIEGFNLKKFLGSSVCSEYSIEDLKGFKEQGMTSLMDIYEKVYLPLSSMARFGASRAARGVPSAGSSQKGTVTVTGSHMYENSDAPKLVGAFRNAGLTGGEWYISLFNIRLSGFSGDFAWLNGKTFNSVGNSALMNGDITNYVRCLTPKAAPPAATMAASCTVRIDQLDENNGRIRVNLESSPFGSGYQSIGGPVFFDYAFPAREGYVKLQKSSARTDLTDGNNAYNLQGAKFSVWSCNSAFTYEDWENKDTNGNPKGLSWQGNFISMADGSARKQSFAGDGFQHIDNSSVGSILTGKENGRNTYLYYEKNSSMMSAPIGSYGIVEEYVPGIYGYYHNKTAKMFNITEANTAGNPATVSFSNTPALDPIDVVLRKVDAETGKPVPSGGASLGGAEFTVKYYPLLTQNVTGLTPKYVFTAVTDDKGYARISKDQLPYVIDPNGVKVYGLPLGTITVQETKAPEGYLINNQVFLAQITLEPKE